MSVWDVVRLAFVQYWFLAWIAFLALALAAAPLVHALRLWRARRRFIERQGALLLNPQNADARFQLANLYADAGAWRRALAYADEAVRVARDNPLFEGKLPYHFLRLLGDALHHRGRLAEAVDAYRRALDVPSELGHADARFGLGRALLRQGKREEAVDVLRRAIQENGSRLEAYFRWAQAAAGLGRPGEVEEARREFRAVAAALPRFARQGRLRWRAAFWLFPLARRIA